MSSHTVLGTSLLGVQMKTGILGTIARSIYSDPGVKIREAVANSMDNHAKWFIIYADSPSLTITLMDNGWGITREKFEEIFKSIGSGKGRDSIYSNSFFGLGLLSILSFGEKAKIVSKPKGEDRVIKLEIDSKGIFSEEMIDKPISDVQEFISVYDSDLAERERLSTLADTEIKKVAGDFPVNFTEIILSGIDPDVFKQVTSRDFEMEIQKILPLRVRNDDPFLAGVKDRTVLDWLKDTMSNPEFCPTIEVFSGESEGGKELSQLWKYFPDFRRDLEFGAADIVYGESNAKFDDEKPKFMYYYLYSTEDLEKRVKKNAEVGFWVRNRNFLVKPSDFMHQSGSKRPKIIQEPLQNWLFGEIFHRNMANFLDVTRNEYIWESSEFEDFYKDVSASVRGLNEKLREIWKIGLEVKRSVVLPFMEIKAPDNPFSRAQGTLIRLGMLNKDENEESILQKLNKRRSEELEKEDNRIDIILAKDNRDIVLADDNKIKVTIDRTIDLATGFVKKIEEVNNRLIMRIASDIFSPEKTEFLGKQFGVYYVAGEENSPGISFDNDSGKIYVNLFNQEVINYSLSFIEVYIAVELADIYSQTKDELRRYLLLLLGEKTKSATGADPRKYLFSLKDELQRRKGSM